MDFSGIIVGLGTFFIIGILHPVVIKSEYHFGKRCWPVFAILGAICCAVSLFAAFVASVLLAVLGFSLFWSIHELFEQEKRVKRGWYPANPGRAGKK